MDFPPQATSRSQSRVLLQTFALRIAVATAYGHLGTLHGLSEQASSAIPRMATLLLLPGAVVRSFATQIMMTALVVGIRAISGEAWAFEHTVMMVLGLRVQVPEAGSSVGGAVRHTTYAADDVDPTCVELRLDPGQSKSPAHLDIGRGVVLLALLAQSAASLFLIARRSSVANATLVLDWSNGLYAFIGICTAVNSLGILALRGRGPQVAPGKALTGPYGRDLHSRLKETPSLREALKDCFSPLSIMTSAMVQSFVVRNFVKNSPLRGIESAPVLWIIWIASIALFALWPIKRTVKETVRRVSVIHDVFTGPAVGASTTAGQSTEAILRGSGGMGRGPRGDGGRPKAHVLVEIIYYACLSVVIGAISLWAIVGVTHAALMSAEHVLFYAAHVREQVLIGAEKVDLGCKIQNWMWNDPWSEKLFVY